MSFFGMRWIQLLSFGAKLCLFTCLVTSIFIAHEGFRSEQSFAASLKQVRIVVPDSKPQLSQESILVAMAIYDIDLPAGAAQPILDMALAERGVTTLHGFGSGLEVSIGPSAFMSWGLLGSTLAHELEVHCRQNFVAIRVRDIIGADGTGRAEREAYEHELHSARRFSLSPQELEQITYTLNFFYPKPVAEMSQFASITQSVQSWLARRDNADAQRY